MIDIKGKKVLHKEAKEVLGNAMDYTRDIVARVREDLRMTILDSDKLEKRLDKVELILDDIKDMNGKTLFKLRNEIYRIFGCTGFDMCSSHYDGTIERIKKLETMNDYKDVTLDDGSCIIPDISRAENPYAHNNADEVQSKFSKAFMEDILNQCDINDCDGVEINITRRGLRVRSYNYDKKT